MVEEETYHMLTSLPRGVTVDNVETPRSEEDRCAGTKSICHSRDRPPLSFPATSLHLLFYFSDPLTVEFFAISASVPPKFRTALFFSPDSFGSSACCTYSSRI